MTNKYLAFLANIVDPENRFSLLIEHLHRIPFRATVPNDDNRAADGIKLREAFLDKSRSNRASSFLPDLPHGDCTVLEMLIGLAHRMEFELYGSAFNKPVIECFWVFLKNLNLDWCTDHEYQQSTSEEIVESKIRMLLNRNYDSNGSGGLFPMNRPPKDQRLVEIWYQMAEYLLEKYEF